MSYERQYQQPSAAGRFDRLHGDEDLAPEYTQDEENLIAGEAVRLTAEKLADRDWWNDKLEGINATTNSVPEALARAMANLDAACNGDEIARNAVLTALSNLQRTATVELREECRTEAEAALAEGELA